MAGALLAISVGHGVMLLAEIGYVTVVARKHRRQAQEHAKEQRALAAVHTAELSVLVEARMRELRAALAQAESADSPDFTLLSRYVGVRLGVIRSSANAAVRDVFAREHIPPPEFIGSSRRLSKTLPNWRVVKFSSDVFNLDAGDFEVEYSHGNTLIRVLDDARVVVEDHIRRPDRPIVALPTKQSRQLGLGAPPPDGAAWQSKGT